MKKIMRILLSLFFGVIDRQDLWRPASRHPIPLTPTHSPRRFPSATPPSPPRRMPRRLKFTTFKAVRVLDELNIP